MHLDEDLEHVNVPLMVGAAISAVIFLLTTAGNPAVIGSVSALLIFSLLIWIVNRKKSTGNTAFEKHQDEAAQNMKKEREAFIKFLEQEQQAQDEAAFTKFMKSK